MYGLDVVNRAASLTALLDGWATQRPDQDAVVYVRHLEGLAPAVLTYSELAGRARRIAGWIARRCAPGDRVLLAYPPGIEFVPAFLGCLYAGVVAVPAPLPGRFAAERRRLAGIAADARVALVLTDAEGLPAVDDWLDDAGPGAAGQRPGAVATDTIPDTGAVTGPVPADRSVLAFLQYTSGSTGDPKGVAVSHGNLLHNFGCIVEAMDLREPVLAGGWVPLYPDMGLIAQTLAPLGLGGTTVLMSPSAFIRRPHLWLRMIHEYGLCFSAAPDFGYALCTEKVTDEQLAGLDLSRWRAAGNGSEPVQPDTMRRFIDRFAVAGLSPHALNPGYGLAEATVSVSGGGAPRPLTTLRADADRLEVGELRGAAGQARVRELAGNGRVRGIDVRVVDPETREVLPDGRIGEIWLRGASVAQGYWGRPELTAETFRAETAGGEAPFLRTGDLGALHDGELFVTGRRKDVLVIHGRNLHPQDVEHELRARHPELAGLAGAVVTVVGPDAGAEQLVVVHEVRGHPAAEEADVLARRMRSTVSREFGVRAAGVLLVRRGAVPRTTSGKIRRRATAELVLSGKLAPFVTVGESWLAERPAVARAAG